MRIAVLVERTGTTVPTILYYEDIGLLRRVARRGGQRIYGHEDTRRLAFIRRCRAFDFSIEDIRSLLSLMQSHATCGEARKLAEGHLAALRAACRACGAGADHHLAGVGLRFDLR